MDELKSDIWVKNPSEQDASRCSLVIGETGGEWAAAISLARRRSPNLSLVTQWFGESPALFCQRVASRLTKRRALGTVVLACGREEDSAVITARMDLLLRCSAAMPTRGDRQLTVLCLPESGSAAPNWAKVMCAQLHKRGLKELDVEVFVRSAAGAAQPITEIATDRVHAA